MSLNHVEIVQSLYAAFGRRDQEALLALIAPDFQIEQSPALPWGGKYSGLEGLVQFFTKLLTHVDSRVEFERYIDAGESVVAIGRVKGTVRANGNTFDIAIAHVWRIRDGKAVAFNPYIENPKMLEALSTTARPPIA